MSAPDPPRQAQVPVSDESSRERRPTPVAGRQRFFSLKWKTLAWVSVVLAVVNIGLVAQGYFEATGEYRSRQALALAQRVTVLKKLLDQSAARLGRIGNIVPGVMNTVTLAKGLDERWEGVQLELQLEVMQLYDRDGHVRMRGVPLWSTPPPELAARLQLAVREERPASFLLCEPECMQYALVPTLGANGARELMVLGTSVADVVLEFPGLSGADLALLIARPDDSASIYWAHYRLAAVSNAPDNEPKLRALSPHTTLADLEQGADLDFGGRQSRFYARPLEAFGSLTPGYFLLFSDTTEALADIRAQFRRQLLIGFTALLAALALLLSVLNRPMNQLRKLAQTLPLLAQNQYGPVRQMIGSAYQRKRTLTEIDVLEAATVDLSHRLEQLEQTVASRNQSLAEKIEEVRRAHDLNEKIFATAPLIFAILAKDWRVVQINAFGSQLLGYSESEVQGMNFMTLLADPRQRSQAGDVLTEVIGGRRPLFEQTGPVKCVDGSLEQVTWLHTRLAAASGDYVLSVGLPDKTLAEPGVTAH